MKNRYQSYLIAGLIAVLILIISTVVSSQEKSLYELYRDISTDELIERLNKELARFKGDTDIVISDAESMTEMNVVYQMRLDILLEFIYIQNQRLLEQNEAIIELLGEIKGK